MHSVIANCLVVRLYFFEAQNLHKHMSSTHISTVAHSQKPPLINIREFKQTYEQLLKQEMALMNEEQQELGFAAQAVHAESLHLPVPPQPANFKHFQEPKQFLIRAEQVTLYDTSDLDVPKPYDIIEAALKEQVEKSSVNDDEYSGNPSEIIKQTGVKLEEIPTIIRTTMRQCFTF